MRRISSRTQLLRQSRRSVLITWIYSARPSAVLPGINREYSRSVLLLYVIFSLFTVERYSRIFGTSGRQGHIGHQAARQRETTRWIELCYWRKRWWNSWRRVFKIRRRLSENECCSRISSCARVGTKDLRSTRTLPVESGSTSYRELQIRSDWRTQACVVAR